MSRQYSVFLSASDPGLGKMFIEAGYTVSLLRAKADIFVFPGGSDVCPVLYGEKPLPDTDYDLDRDLTEVKLFKSIPMKAPKIGICRGGQFLNVMSGGSMYQDVNGHTKSHSIRDTKTNKSVFVTSTHHQMMIPAAHGKILADADESTMRETEMNKFTREKNNKDAERDTEAVWYEYNNTLCFQPHPEYSMKSCHDYFFELVAQYILPVLSAKGR